MQKIIPILLLLAGLAVSATAAYYSIFGLTKLFAGAVTQVAIMATALEVAKLITASAVYRFWKVLSNLLKVYLITAVVVLIVITSLGAYGFLSSAYEQTANVDKISSLRIERVETNLEKFKAIKLDYISEKNQVLNDINSLRLGVTKVLDASETKSAIGNATQNRKLIQKQLDDAIKTRDLLDNKLSAVNDSIFKYEGISIDTKSADSTTSELGPLKYLSRVSGLEMDRIVNWLILLIVLVFDPLAVCLLITASSILMQIKPKGKSNDAFESDTLRNIKPIVSEVIQTPPPPAPIPIEEIESITEPEEYELTDEEEEIIAANPDQPVSFNQLKAMTADQRKEYLKGLGKV